MELVIYPPAKSYKRLTKKRSLNAMLTLILPVYGIKWMPITKKMLC